MCAYFDHDIILLTFFALYTFVMIVPMKKLVKTLQKWVMLVFQFVGGISAYLIF